MNNISIEGNNMQNTANSGSSPGSNHPSFELPKLNFFLGIVNVVNTGIDLSKCFAFGFGCSNAYHSLSNLVYSDFIEGILSPEVKCGMQTAFGAISNPMVFATIFPNPVNLEYGVHSYLTGLFMILSLKAKFDFCMHNHSNQSNTYRHIQKITQYSSDLIAHVGFEWLQNNVLDINFEAEYHEALGYRPEVRAIMAEPFEFRGFINLGYHALDALMHQYGVNEDFAQRFIYYGVFDDMDIEFNIDFGWIRAHDPISLPIWYNLLPSVVTTILYYTYILRNPTKVVNQENSVTADSPETEDINVCINEPSELFGFQQQVCFADDISIA